VADARFAETASGAAEELAGIGLRLALGSAFEGFEACDDALSGQSQDDPSDPRAGTTMFYTSGTTGRPKGVSRPPGARLRAPILVAQYANYDGACDRHLCTGPLYHAAPLAFSVLGPLAVGVGIVLMDGWQGDEMLRLVEEHSITHTHMVPTMFHRLLSLPPEQRNAADVSSLRFIVHGAAPCSIALKRRMMEWLGPILYEYYSATEGFGSFVTPEEWLARPGTVGRPEPGHIEVRSDAGLRLAAGEVGELYLRSPRLGRFEYFGDHEKTRDTYDESGEFFSLGDIGTFDEDGYLYVRDRSADLIISGGVNISPAEADAVLLEHPTVADVATIGVPDESFGESVHSVIELRAGESPSPRLAEEIIEFCRERLAHYKCPRSVSFDDALPRHETGKILRRQLREQIRSKIRG